MDLTPEEARLQKRSVSLSGHKTSVSLEKAFWVILERAAQHKGISLSQLIKDMDADRKAPLARTLRLYALTYTLKKK